MKPFKAWHNVASGTIIPSTPANVALGNKPTYVQITAVYDEGVGDYVNVDGDANIAAAMSSKSITRILSSIQSLDARRAELIGNLVTLPGGEAALKALGIDPNNQVASPLETLKPTPAADPELENMKAKSRAKVPLKVSEVDL